MTGDIWSYNFPITPGAYQTKNTGIALPDAYVTKLNPTGTALVYSTYLGGRYPDSGSAIAVDSSGNAYVTGYTMGNFPTTSGAFQPASGGGRFDAFVMKLNATGTALVYSAYLGGSDDYYWETFREGGSSIAVDAAGNAYITGGTDSSDLPTTRDAFQTIGGDGDKRDAVDNEDTFLAKLNTGGRQ